MKLSKGLSNAIQKKFVACELQYYFFHYNQSIWCRIQEDELINEYKNNSVFKIHIKKIIYCAFLADSDIYKFFQRKKNTLESNEKYKEFDNI